jgi:hypothetical protein
MGIKMNIFLIFIFVSLGVLLAGSLLLLVYYLISRKKRNTENTIRDEHYFSTQENFENLTKKSDEILSHVKNIYQNIESENNMQQVINIEEFLDIRGITKRNKNIMENNIDNITLTLLINNTHKILIGIIVNHNNSSILLSSSIMSVKIDDKKTLKYLMELNGICIAKIVLRSIDQGRSRLCFEYIFYSLDNVEQFYTNILNQMIGDNLNMLNIAKERNWNIELADFFLKCESRKG